MSDRIELLFPPILLLMELADIDTIYPSIGMKTTCRVADMFTYENEELWFTTEAYDVFLGELIAMSKGTADKASIEDMQSWFKLTLVRTDQGALCELSAFFSHPGYGSETRLTFASPARVEIIAATLDRFRAFPKWW